jgi:replicative DNA helicase
MSELDASMRPTHSVESEQSVLGGLMLDNNAYDRIADELREADFYRTDHRLIWRHIVRLIDAGKRADVITVFESLQREKMDAEAGGLEYLNALAMNTPSAAGIKSYAGNVIERAKKRSLMLVAATVMQEAAGSRNADELAAECELALMSAVDRATEDPVPMSQAMTEACDYIEERQAGKRGLLTGFTQFDDLTAGMEPGGLYLCGARPANGKTVFAVNVADVVASAGNSVLFISLEMPRREIALRLMAGRSEVAMHAMRAGRMTDGDFAAVSDVREASSAQRLFIDDRPAVSVAYVRAKARRLKRQHGLHLVVIDYLGLMTGQGDNRAQEIGSISRGLKALAKELAVPILVLAQLNRALEGRAEKRPLLSDLRDSGEIEQDADLVVMLHREETHNPTDEWRGLAELLVRKNRNGPLGTCVLEFDGSRMRFSNTARQLPTAPVVPFHRQGLK